MLRAPETGSHNLADFVTAHGAELGLDPMEITGPDEVVAPHLFAHLDAHREGRRRAVHHGVVATLRQVQSEARWRGEQVVLPLVPFFRLASPTTGKKYVRFVGDGVDVTVPRKLLQRAGTALRAFRDVSATVDSDGVHLRWGARGQLNFFSQRLKTPDDALVVSLPTRTIHRTMPVLLGEILAQLAFGT